MTDPTAARSICIETVASCVRHEQGRGPSRSPEQVEAESEERDCRNTVRHLTSPHRQSAGEDSRQRTQSNQNNRILDSYTPKEYYSRPMKAKSTLPILDPVFVPDERKADVRRRLKRARGQVDGIERMLSANRPCAEILQQIAAAQEALRGAGKLMVRNYMEKCATEGIKAGRGQEVYDEFLDLIYRMVR